MVLQISRKKQIKRGVRKPHAVKGKVQGRAPQLPFCLFPGFGTKAVGLVVKIKQMPKRPFPPAASFPAWGW